MVDFQSGFDNNNSQSKAKKKLNAVGKKLNVLIQ